VHGSPVASDTNALWQAFNGSARAPVDRRSRTQPSLDVIGELLGIQSACAAWLDAVPDSFRATATRGVLQAIVDRDLDVLAASSRCAVTAD
jgi:hypothetical protein